VLSTYFFDLDGTLCDSRPGLALSFEAAFAELGMYPGNLSRFLGVSLPEAFRTLDPSIDDHGIGRGIKAFRAAYEQEGIRLTPEYPGIRDLLECLTSRGATAWIVTSKPQKYASKVVENSQVLSKYIAGVVGTGLKEEEHKTELLQIAIRRSRANVNRSIMVGDRCYDVVGAINNEMRPVGALWGYGTKKELKQAGCHDFCHDPYELRDAFVVPNGVLEPIAAVC